MENDCIEYEKYFKKINNDRIINFSECDFGYVEHKDYAISHPLSDYTFNIWDISINALVTLKWVNHAFYFFDSISKTIREVNDSDESLISTLPQNLNYTCAYNAHSLYIDTYKINNIEEYVKLINELYSEPLLFTENTKVKFKLKINLSDFILLQNTFIPVLFL